MAGKVKVFGARPDGDGSFGHMTSGAAILLSCHSTQVTTVVKERQE